MLERDWLLQRRRVYLLPYQIIVHALYLVVALVDIPVESGMSQFDDDLHDDDSSTLAFAMKARDAVTVKWLLEKKRQGEDQAEFQRLLWSLFEQLEDSPGETTMLELLVGAGLSIDHPGSTGIQFRHRVRGAERPSCCSEVDAATAWSESHQVSSE